MTHVQNIKVTPTRFSKVLAIIVSLIIALKSTLFFGKVEYVYFAVIICMPVYFIFIHRGKVFLPTLGFIIISAISLLINDINPLFRPYERFLIFACMVLGLGPFFISERTNVFRLFILRCLLVEYFCITLTSFIFFLLGRGFIPSGFAGISVHPMDLAPIAALSVLFLIDHFKLKKWGSFITIPFAIIAFFVLILSASRGAIVSLALSLVVFCIIKLRDLKTILAAIVSFLILFVWLIAANPMNVTENLSHKFERIEREQDVTGGRDIKTINRLNEFLQKPLIGVGFSSMTTTEINAKGQFEPSNGWLFVLSSTGILGFLLVIVIFIPPLFKYRRNNKMALVLAIDTFFIVHTIIEGYTISAGNPLCIVMWMNAAIINQPEQLYE